ncbi:unnamed protein product [Ascophyllum nodosum]
MVAGADRQRLWDFCDWQMKIGDGTKVDVSEYISLPSENDKATVFPDEASVLRASGSDILAPRNDRVRLLNTEIVQRLPKLRTSFFSIDTAADPSCIVLCPPEFRNPITPTERPSRKLSLDVGAPRILLRSINPSHDLFNGTRLILSTHTRRVFKARVASKPYKGRGIFILCVVLNFSEAELPFTLKRRQIAVALV